MQEPVGPYSLGLRLTPYRWFKLKDGQPFPVTIAALNAQGQPLEWNGAVQLYSEGVTVKPTLVQFVNGSWSGFVTIYGAGTDITLTAFAAGMTGSSAPITVAGLGSESSYLSGLVSDLTGTPLAGASVYLTPGLVLEAGDATLETVADGSGRYAFGPLEASQYTLWAEYGGDPRRESDRMFPRLSSYGPQTQNIEINVYPGGIPVLLVPGILGSDAKTNRWPSPRLPRIYPADTKKLMLHDPLGKVGWAKLVDELKACGFSGYRVPYDWRAPVKEVAEKYLKPAIERAKRETDSAKVYIVAHSTGGLAARYYIQNIQEQDSGGDVAKLAMVGTPHLGSVNAYYAWAGGDPKRADDLNDHGLGSLLNIYWNSIEGLYEKTYKLGDLDSDEYNRIYAFVRSAHSGADVVGAELHDLLPTFDFLFYKDSGDWGLTSKDNRNATLVDLNADPKRSERMTADGAGSTVRTAVFYSNSEDTIRRHETSDPVYFLVHAPRYAEGMPSPWVDPEWASGDGTVLDFSAKLPCSEGWAACYSVGGVHSGLVGAAKTKIRDFLAEDQTVCVTAASTARAAATANASELAVGVQGRVRPYLMTPDGAKAGVNPTTGLLEEGILGARLDLDAQDGAITLSDPADGVYQVSVSGLAQEEIMVDLSFLTEAAQHSKQIRLFHHGGRTDFAFSLDAVATEPLTVIHSPEPPFDVKAEAVMSGVWLTRIAWQPSPTRSVSGYRVYGKSNEEPFMTLLGTTSGSVFDTGLPWAGENGASLGVFAVSASLPDGSESLLSDFVENNDRDHDGLRDGDEAQLGTDPELRDTDGDGLEDSQEVGLGTSPKQPDTDGDAVSDGQDAFPLDASEWTDSDGDGIGNNADPDDDNDGILDTEDAYPLDPALPGSSSVIALKPGLNVIAYLSAVSAEHATCQGLFASLGGTALIERVTRYDPLSQTFESCDGTGGTDFPIVAGEGYLVEAHAATSAVLSGAATCPDLTLVAGLNLRGHPQPPAGLSCYQWLNELGPDAVTAMQRLDRNSGRFQGCVFRDADGVATPVGQDFPIVPGEGYLLFSPTGGVSIPLSCGG